MARTTTARILPARLEMRIRELAGIHDPREPRRSLLKRLKRSGRILPKRLEMRLWELAYPNGVPSRRILSKRLENAVYRLAGRKPI